jgi:hypothetical protein
VALIDTETVDVGDLARDIIMKGQGERTCVVYLVLGVIDERPEPREALENVLVKALRRVRGVHAAETLYQGATEEAFINLHETGTARLQTIIAALKVAGIDVKNGNSNSQGGAAPARAGEPVR